MSTHDYDVIVVGAGIAGLTAAYELKKRSPSTSVLVLEAKNRVGGRTSTITMQSAKGTDQWDIGGQWVGRTQRHLLDLLHELDIEIYEQYTTGRKFARIGSDKIRYYTGTLPVKDLLTLQYSPFELLDFAVFMSRIESMSNKLNPDDMFSHPLADHWDSISVQNFAHRISWTQTVRDAIDAMCFVAMGVHSSRISLLYLLYYGRRAGSITDFLEATGNGAQGFRIAGGSQQICEMLTEKLGAENVLLDHAVRTIEYDDQGVRLYTTYAKSFRSKKLILAIPPQQAGYVHYDPPLPESKRQLLSSFPMANLVKFIVTYQKAFWRQKGFSGEIVSLGDSVSDGPSDRPVICTFDATTAHGSPAIVGFLSLAWCDKDESERRDAVLVDLARYLGEEALVYVDYVDKNWSTEPFSGGCPVGIVPPGMMHYFQESINNPIMSIHWAGTETASEWCGYMSGAVQSGLRAANEVLLDFGAKTVNVEHLEKTLYNPEFVKIKRVKKKSSKCPSRFVSPSRLAALCVSVAVGIYLVKRFNVTFDSPIKAKFISSF